MDELDVIEETMPPRLLKYLLWAIVYSGCFAFILGVFYAWVRLSPSNRDAAIENGMKNIDVAQDFNRLFPEAEQFISNYQGSLDPFGYAKPTWTSHVGLYGRYTVSAKFNIELDWTRRHPTRAGQPRFIVQEISSITRLPDGRIETTYSDGRFFGDHEWKLLKEANGDFSAIGYPMHRDQGLEGFEEAWR